MTEIVPAIIPKKFEDIDARVNQVSDFVELVHVDISDGIFTQHKTWPYVGDKGEFAQLAQEELGLPLWDMLDYEFHLMIEKPEESVAQWIALGASSIVVHAEATTDMNSMVSMCTAAEVAIGIAINASTDISVIEPYADRINFVQCMGSDDLGHHGAAFDERVYDKIRTLRAKYPDMTIAVDIGVTRETAPQLIHAGVNKLIAGHSIFESGDSAEAIEYFANL